MNHAASIEARSLWYLTSLGSEHEQGKVPLATAGWLHSASVTRSLQLTTRSLRPQDVLLDVVSREMERVAKNSDNWQERMNALVEMQRAFESLDTIAGGKNVSTDVWRALKPLKGMIQDLRSQIVKEVCALLVTISKTTRDAMVPFLREILQSLIDVRGGGNKVCGNYCGECLETMVTYTVVKGPTLRFFVDLMLESKNKMIRLSCITCMKLAVISWSAMHDKSDVQQLEKALKNALYDASSSCRSESNEFFLVFQQSFSKRAALLMTMLDYKVQKRLEALNEAGVRPLTHTIRWWCSLTVHVIICRDQHRRISLMLRPVRSPR